ncbi:MAG: alpha/beta hydrolase [Actinomycetota bacterium]|jgi:acetyl esterase|nr:alpha/beta hydrolase [Actinomycetota bacterium]
MSLHPEVQAITDAVPVRSFAEVTIEQARAAHAAGSAARPKGPEQAEVSELQLGGCEVTRYRPHDATGAGLVFFHGGGWVLGSRVTHDGPCRYLAAASGATVFNVEYRLAPEHRFPAAYDDAVASVRELLAGADDAVDPARVGVAGDSAGGNLAAAAAIALRGSDLPELRAQLLIYPAVDAAMSAPSHTEFGGGPFLTAADMTWFYEEYAPGVDAADPRLSPLAAPDLAGLPAALVITAENDVLRDEGEAYAMALAEAGVDAAASRILGATHGFFGWTHAAAPSRAALHQAAAWLRSQLA